MSIYGSTTKENRVVYDEDGSCTERKASGKNTPRRLDKTLWSLDVWTQIPRSLVAHHVVRRAASFPTLERTGAAVDAPSEVVDPGETAVGWAPVGHPPPLGLEGREVYTYT